MRSLSARALVRLAVFLLGISSAAAAQPPTGTIGGVITGGAAVPLSGATVTVHNETVDLTRTVTTGPDGDYSVSGLPLQGAYEVRIEAAGFAPVVQSGISLVAEPSLILNITILATSAETLAVTGRAPTLDPQRATVRQTVTEALVHSLPLVGRDFITLASLTAGFNGNPYYPSSQGQIYWSNNVIVDGASHFSKWRGAARTFYSGYGLEAIKEVQVLTSQFSAEYGEALASVTTAVTRSGTDQFHGSALFFLQDDALNDRPVFAADAPFGLQRYGATLGGPIVKDRTQFFTSFEGRRSRAKTVVVSPEAAGALARNDQDEQLLFVKVDQRTGEQSVFTERYSGQWFSWHDEPGGLTLPGTGTATRNNVHTFFVSDTRLLSPAALNQARLQYSRYSDVRRDLRPSLLVSRAGYSVEGGTLGPFGFGAAPEDTWEAADTLAYKRGAHALKFGAGLKHTSAYNQSLPYGWGAYFFGGPPSLFPVASVFQQGLSASAAAATATPRSLAVSAFAQDDWRVTPVFTLNAGLRYDVERISNVDGFDARVDTNNLQPRVGVAWTPFADRLVVRGGIGLYTQQHLLYYINRVDLEGASGTTMVTLTPESPLMPSFPGTLPLGALTGGPARDIYVADPSFRNPSSIQVTAGVERELFGFLLSGDYVHLRGRDLMSIVDLNAPASIVKPAQRTAAAADATRPIVPGPGGVRKIISLGNEGESWYRALQIRASRTTGRLQMTGSYTVAKAEDQANYRLPEDSLNLAAEKARADTDVRHNLAVGVTWQVPAVRRALNGLSISAYGLFRSGRPYTISWGDDRNGTSQNDARPGRRNTAETDGFRSIDLSLTRQFRVGRQAIEARAEVYNLLSTTNYDEYVGVLSSPFFGRPVTAFPTRRMQLAAIIRF